MRAFLTAALSVAALALGACSGEEAPPQDPVVRPVKIQEIAGAAAGGVFEFPGTVDAGQEAELAFEVEGKIVELPVTEGQNVSKGQVLARLDARDYIAARDSDEAAMKAARSEYKRFEDLYASDAVSLQDLETKRRLFEQAEAQLRTTRKAVDDTRLVAPFAGKIARKVVDGFENVRAKQPVLLLQDASGLEIVVDIPEQDATGARAGVRGRPRVVVSSVPDREFPATLKEFATTADPATRTFEVTCAFDPPADGSVLPGMTAKLIIDAGTGSGEGGAIKVPSHAVVAAADGSSYVWLVDGSSMKVSRRTVTVGQLSGGTVEILSGLSPGDLVAVTGAAHLREEMQVRRLGS